MDNLQSNIITLRVSLGSYISEINNHMPLCYYGVLLHEVEISSQFAILFLTLNELKIFLNIVD